MNLKTNSRPTVQGPVPFRALAFHSALAALVLWCSWAAAGPRNVKPGDPVGDFRLKDLEGRGIDTSLWRGRPSVWLFASPGQKSSEKAILDLQASLDELEGSGIRAVVLTVHPGQASYFRQLSSRHSLRIPVVLDAEREVYGRIGVIAFPTTLLVDGKGRLHLAISGHSLDYRQKLAPHLAYLAGKISAEELKRSLSPPPGDRDGVRERADRLCRSAEIFLERGLLSGAETELRRAIEVDPECEKAHLRLAEVLAAGGKIEDAEKLIQEIQKHDPGDHKAKLILGMIRFHQKRLAEAEELLKEALLLNPDPVKSHYWLGRVYEARGLHEKAAAHFRAALEKVVPGLSIPGKAR